MSDESVGQPSPLMDLRHLPATDLIESLPDAIVCIDGGGRMIAVNGRTEALFGYERAALNGATLDLLLPERHRAAHHGHLHAYLAKPHTRPMGAGLRLTARHRDGHEFPIDVSLSPIQTPDGPMVIAAIRDLSERRHMELAIGREEEWRRLLLEHVQDVVYVLSFQGTAMTDPVLTLYGPVERLTGHSAPAFLADPSLWYQLIHPSDLPSVEARTQQILASGEAGIRTYRLRSKGTTTWRWIEDKMAPRRDRDGNVELVFGIARDVTDRKNIEEQLVRQSVTDALTNLPNRTRLIERLNEAIAHARRIREADAGPAVLFLDLDGFKHINDSLGHTVGDQVLVTIARRIAASIRPEDTVARFGGDEFVILLSGHVTAETATRIAERVQAVIQEPVTAQGRRLRLTASIGIALIGGDGAAARADDLLRQADTAMYRAKAQGAGNLTVFDQEMHTGAIARLDMEAGLRDAVGRGDLRLHYQPIVDLRSGATFSAEALLRWLHPEHGSIPPERFIPLAEETNLIIPIGQWVLTEACRQAQEWTNRGAAAGAIVSVNLSARQFQDARLVERIHDALRRSGLPANRLCLEITETTVMQDAGSAIMMLNDLRSAGVRVALDDFGAGYSSLSYLSRLPIDILKIDRSFVRDLTVDRSAVAIIRGIIATARELGIDVIAEGIETREQLATVYALGCHLGQGFYFATPQEPERLFGSTDGDRGSA